MWDERYGSEEYAYGKLPNEFLKEMSARLPKGGQVLCLAEGEGRNSVWLAQQGFKVTGIDASAVGLAKARRLAAEAGVEIETVHMDLAQADLGEARWDGIVSIFCHLPPPLRKAVHAKVVRALKPGGVFLLEAYTLQLLDYRTGGPPSAEMMMSLVDLREELAGLSIEHGIETVREVVEGRFHTGHGAVVQFIARKPESAG
jgi:2-polyprenyl-3-methyl-5-hydroxy-6-metoxy-1,4-benzoquinol methylase